ncbi:DUF4190 domain-containing protein [Streptomyces sp. bgisy022]|uniref:DUF4190 domain-containing protein n=1 Tax=Streptomyces sp. bgisy022 TaxID=3413769 RepID=UPI003D759A88
MSQQYPPQPQQAGYGEPRQPGSNGLATTALVLGIVAVVVSFIPVLNVVVWPLAVLGIIFGAIGLSKAGKVGKGKAAGITGLITSVAAIMMFFAMNALFFSAVDKAGEELDKSYDSATVGDGDSKTGGTEESEVMKDFKITKCDVITGDLGIKELAIHVDYVNNGDRRYSYLVEGEVLADGKKVNDFMSTAENIAPGQKFTDKNAGALVNADEIKDAAKLECKTVKASRTNF